MEKNKVGEFHFVTESYLMDFRGRITIPMIGTYLLHAASCHAADRGFGYNDMTERHAYITEHRRVCQVTLQTGNRQFHSQVFQNRSCDTQITFRIFKVNRIHFMRHRA